MILAVLLTLVICTKLDGNTTWSNDYSQDQVANKNTSSKDTSSKNASSHDTSSKDTPSQDQINSDSTSVVNVYEKYPPAIIAEIDKLSLNYSDLLQDSPLLTQIILAIGCYFLFLGKLTKRLSLSFILSIFLFHYIESIQDTNINLVWPIPLILNNINNLMQSTGHPYITILVVSFILSILIIYLLSLFGFLVGLAATYLFYITYIENLINVQDEIYIFYISAFIIVLLVYFIFERAINIIFVLLFSLTGSLIIFMTVEKVFNIEWNLSTVLLVLKSDWENKFPSYLSMIYILFTGMGIYIQGFFVTPLSRL